MEKVIGAVIVWGLAIYGGVTLLTRVLSELGELQSRREEDERRNRPPEPPKP